MKTHITIIILFLFIGFSYQSVAQVQYNNCSATGTNASAIGNKTTAGGNNSLSGGYGSKAIGSNSLAFGYNSSASGSTTTAIGNTAITTSTGSMALGNYVKAAASYTYVFGSGTTASYPLTNSTPYSIAFGVNSNIPTMLITKSTNNNFTGKVAVGPVSIPSAKLHVKSDNNEDANVLIDVTNKNSNNARISLFDNNHFIKVDKSADMEIHAENGALKMEGAHYCFGNAKEEKARLYTSDIPTFYINAYRNGIYETKEDEGASYAIRFDNTGMTFRTAVEKRDGNPKNINWNNAMCLLNDGRIGIGSETTYLKNSNDMALAIHAPQTINVESEKVRLSGKIGINTDNDVNGYALAVNGGIISNKVYVKEVNLWPDHVFADDYTLMELKDLKQYLTDNRHLPGLPSEKEVLENGYDMGEMQSVMLLKIEELTRYVLLLQDEIDNLRYYKALSTDSIVFSYDRNGNRISRRLAFERITEPKHQNPIVTASDYTLFPNPTSSGFCLQLNKPENGTTIQATLVGISGIVLEAKESKDNRIEFDLSGRPNGVYILEVDGPTGQEAWKVIKE